MIQKSTIFFDRFCNFSFCFPPPAPPPTPPAVPRFSVRVVPSLLVAEAGADARFQCFLDPPGILGEMVSDKHNLRLGKKTRKRACRL